MKSLFLILCVLLSFHLSGQFGVSAYYQNFTAPEWEAALGRLDTGKESVPFVRQGYRVGVDYWVKPFEDTRITLQPELSYSRSEKSEFTEGATTLTRNYNYQSLNLGLPVNVYLFDLEGDCDCPTWSKSEPFFKKGFFLQLMPAMHFNRYQANLSDDTAEVGFQSNSTNFSLAGGAGLDIGFSDLVTLSPTVRYVHHFNKSWSNLLERFDQPDPNPVYDADPAGWELGLRLGIRLDY